MADRSRGAGCSRPDRGRPRGRGGAGFSGTTPGHWSASGAGARHPLGPRAWRRPVALDRGTGGGVAAGRLDLAGPPSVEPAPAAVPDDGALSDGTTAPTPPVGEAAETSAVVVVSVVGLVVRPGLVTLPAGARVADAVAAAEACSRKRIRRRSTSLPSFPMAPRSPSASRGAEQDRAAPVRCRRRAPEAGSRVDLNSATAAELDALPGIGPVLAQRIVDHRTRNGPFRSVDQLDDVPGIGPAIAAELAELVAV